MITGSRQQVDQFPTFIGDITDDDLIKNIIKEHPEIEGVVHCAGKILVPESVLNPDQYYYENVSKSLQLFTTLRTIGIKKILFSSTK